MWKKRLASAAPSQPPRGSLRQRGGYSAHQTSRTIEFLQDAYLLFAVPKFSPSFKQRVVAPNKYYAIDNALRRVNSPNLTADVGHRLENAVFLSLRRRGVKPC